MVRGIKDRESDRIFATAMEIVGSLSGDVPPIKSDKAVRNAWTAYTALADKYNEPDDSPPSSASSGPLLADTISTAM